MTAVFRAWAGILVGAAGILGPGCATPSPAPRRASAAELSAAALQVVALAREDPAFMGASEDVAPAFNRLEAAAKSVGGADSSASRDSFLREVANASRLVEGLINSPNLTDDSMTTAWKLFELSNLLHARAAPETAP